MSRVVCELARALQNWPGERGLFAEAGALLARF
jgi:hypothetical protein